MERKPWEKDKQTDMQEAYLNKLFDERLKKTKRKYRILMVAIIIALVILTIVSIAFRIALIRYITR